MNDENVRAWIELINGRLEKVEQVIYGIPPLHVPGIIERVERAHRAAVRGIWMLALGVSIWLLLLTLTIIVMIMQTG